jgi:hypothetical protein
MADHHIAGTAESIDPWAGRIFTRIAWIEADP